MIMAKEEQRLLRADILKRNEELKLLNQELEEAYVELDNLGENGALHTTTTFTEEAFR